MTRDFSERRVVRALVSLDEACTIGCRFCFRSDTGRQRVSVDQFTRTVSRLVQNGFREVCLTGGEPTHHPRFAQLVRACRQFGAHVSVISACGNDPGAFWRLSAVAHLCAHITISADSAYVMERWGGRRPIDLACRAAARLVSKCRSVSLNVIFHRVAASDVGALSAVVHEGVSIELSPLNLSGSTLGQIITRRQLAEELLADVEHLKQRFKVPATLVTRIGDIYGRQSPRECASGAVYISPRGEIRGCPYGAPAGNIMASATEARVALRQASLGSLSSEKRCSLLCAP